MGENLSTVEPKGRASSEGVEASRIWWGSVPETFVPGGQVAARAGCEEGARVTDPAALLAGAKDGVLGLPRVPDDGLSGVLVTEVVSLDRPHHEAVLAFKESV
ncbi:unnamed protein product [Pylaiella littoralis]